MKQGFESTPENSISPRVGVVEENPESHKTRDRSFTALPDVNIGDPAKMHPSERNENFKRAYEAVVGNKGLEMLVVRSMRAMKQGNASLYSQVTNKLTEECILLPDDQIDNIIRIFIDGLQKHIFNYQNELNLSYDEIREVQSFIKADGKGLRGLETGIKSVTHFVRARKKLHALEPKIIPSFYFENYLDSRYGIDLVEVIEREDGVVLNLIQIKSRAYELGDIERNTESHRDWVNGFTIDLAAYERNFSEEPEDSPQMKEFLTNVDKVQDIFLDIFTGGENISKQLLFQKLGIGDRPKVQQVWILNEYLPGVIDMVDGLKVEGVIGDEEYLKIMPLFDEMRAQLEAVKYQKKDLTGIAEVHSICAVDERQVSDVIIFKAQGDKRKSIKIEH